MGFIIHGCGQDKPTSEKVNVVTPQNMTKIQRILLQNIAGCNRTKGGCNKTNYTFDMEVV